MQFKAQPQLFHLCGTVLVLGAREDSQLIDESMSHSDTAPSSLLALNLFPIDSDIPDQTIEKTKNACQAVTNADTAYSISLLVQKWGNLTLALAIWFLFVLLPTSSSSAMHSRRLTFEPKPRLRKWGAWTYWPLNFKPWLKGQITQQWTLIITTQMERWAKFKCPQKAFGVSKNSQLLHPSWWTSPVK